MTRFSSLVLLCLIGIAHACAQQDWTHSQYQFNLFDANSAYAGNHGTLSMAARHRSQWMGMTGAPTSDQFSLHTPFANDQAGAGLNLVSDRIGARKQLSIKGTGVYKVRFNNAKLAFGLTGGFIRQCVDLQALHAQDDGDAVIAGVTQSRSVPTVGASVLLSSTRYFLGVEAAHLNRANWDYTADSQSRLYRHFTTVGGIIFPISDVHLLEISGLAKYAEGGQWQAEVNAQFLYRNLCWIGAGYRLKSAIQVTAAWMVSDHLRIGLSYDYAVGNQFMQPANSVEGFLGFTLEKRSAHSMRYF